MLLIIFLGLIAKLALVSGECVVGTQEMKNFDWSKFSGPKHWYWHLHTPSIYDNNIDCPVSTYAPPEGNISLITTDAYNISAQRHMKYYANATNWKSTGYWEESYQQPSMSAQSYVIAVDYDRYAILRYFEADQMTLYVVYRSQHPDKATVKEVLKELKKNKIDVRQFVKFPTDHCQ